MRERVREVSLGDADAGIDDPHQEAFVRDSQIDTDTTPARRELDRIGQQVEQDLPQGALVGAQQRQAVAEEGLQIDLGRSEEHASELQSLMRRPYAVFRLEKKQKQLNIK